eukprot:1380375-Pyramimonas_sp.AAC.1
MLLTARATPTAFPSAHAYSYQPTKGSDLKMDEFGHFGQFLDGPPLRTLSRPTCTRGCTGCVPQTFWDDWRSLRYPKWRWLPRALRGISRTATAPAFRLQER